MIFVKRSSPARTPADSAPTTFLTGSLVGPVMISPLELVLTAVSNRRSSKGASGAISKTLRWKAAEKVWLVRVAVVVVAAMSSHPAPAARKEAATKSFSFLPMTRLLPWKRRRRGRGREAAYFAVIQGQCGSVRQKYVSGEKICPTNKLPRGGGRC